MSPMAFWSRIDVLSRALRWHRNTEAVAILRPPDGANFSGRGHFPGGPVAQKTPCLPGIPHSGSETRCHSRNSGAPCFLVFLGYFYGTRGTAKVPGRNPQTPENKGFSGRFFQEAIRDCMGFPVFSGKNRKTGIVAFFSSPNPAKSGTCETSPHLSQVEDRGGSRGVVLRIPDDRRTDRKPCRRSATNGKKSGSGGTPADRSRLHT